MVEVFKTNVVEAGQAERITGVLQQHLPGSRINFDLDDCDRVLRVEGDNIVVGHIIRLVSERGFVCEEMV